MKKVLSIVLATMLCFSITVIAYADASFKVSCTGETNVSVPSETMSFTVVPDSANPDQTKTLTITLGSDNQYIISYPTFTVAGVYKFSITQNGGNSQGVSYDTGTIGFEILVIYNNDQLIVSTSGLSRNEGGNKKDTFENTYAIGFLSINNTVTGNIADQSLELPFTVTLTAEKYVNTPIIYTVSDGASKYDSYTIEAGWTGAKTVQINLKAKDRVDFNHIPVGVTYTVAADDNNYGYTTSITDGNGTITENGRHLTTISSTKEASINTGLNMDSLPYLLILCVAMLGLLVLILHSHRIKKD